ncbi:hypothetical protein A3Q56_08162, partial [Intoshia linei]
MLRFITQKGFFNDIEKLPTIPAAVTAAVSWRKPGIYYPNNEILFDVLESINTLIDSQGRILQHEVVGKVLMNCHLSGMPMISIRFNDRIKKNNHSQGKLPFELEGIKFHQCVRLSDYSKSENILCIPPDGESELMTYKIRIM